MIRAKNCTMYEEFFTRLFGSNVIKSNTVLNLMLTINIVTISHSIAVLINI